MERAAAPGSDPHRPHSDRRDLARVGALCVDPYSGVLVHAARPRQPEIGQRLDDDPFEAVHVRRTGCRVVGHGHDRVRHELARPVVGDVPTSVGPLEHGADLRRVDEDVALVGVRPERVGVRVLQEEQVVVVGLDGQGMLQRRGLVVRDRSQRPDAQHRPGPQSSAAQSRLPSSSETRAKNSET